MSMLIGIGMSSASSGVAAEPAATTADAAHAARSIDVARTAGQATSVATALSARPGKTSSTDTSVYASADMAPGPLVQWHGQHPLKTISGLPAVAARHRDGSEWQVALEHASLFMGGLADDEALFLDGESSQLTLRHRRRVGRCWQAEASLPMLRHSGGFADSYINQWHSVFGLPDAERDTFPEDELHYEWIDGQGNPRRIKEPSSGIGDIQFSVQRSLGCRKDLQGERHRTIARLGLTVPSGNEDALRGLGAPAYWGDLQSPVFALGNRYRLGAAIGALFPGLSDRAPEQHEAIIYGSIGIEARLGPRWSALAQLDAHSPMYKSDLRELGDVGTGLGVGFRLRIGARHALEFGIVEDIVIDSTPDIVGRVAWRYRP